MCHFLAISSPMFFTFCALAWPDDNQMERKKKIVKRDISLLQEVVHEVHMFNLIM